MFKVRSIWWIILACIASLWVIACSPQSGSNSNTAQSPQSQPLAVGTNPWIGYSGHHVALKKGFYQQAGLTIQDQLFQSDTEQITAFLAGKLDLAWLTTGAAMQIAAKEPTSRIIFLVDYSNGSDGILGRNIKTPADVKGKTIARENILFQKVLLRAFLEKGGLTEKDLTIRDMTAADGAVAFSAKRIDGAVTYEPFLTKAAKEGGGEVIFSTKGTNLVADVIVARQSVLANRRNDLLTYLKASDQGIKLLKAGDATAMQAAADRLGIKPEEVREQLAGVTLFDIEGNKSIGFNAENPSNGIKNFELTAKAAYDFKLVSQPIEVKNTYDDSLVKSL